MFLTRLGPGSKAVVTGDVTQVDLVDTKESGLVRISHILEEARGVAFVRFEKRDVVRHPLVREILARFEAHENGEGKG
jgi:phosphate starvation-inducible PhoH-like protein